MTITQINHFITVADTLSFTQAAHMLYVSQPAISKSISKLEEHFGFKLFERTDNSLSLTIAGETMYKFFTRTTEEFNTVLEDVLDSVLHPASTVRIGCPETWNPTFFYRAIDKHFSDNHPDIKLHIECHKLSELISRLQSGKLDILLTHDFFIPTLPNLSAQNVVSTNFGILYSKETFGDVTSIKAFENSPFLLFDNDIEKRISNIIHSICSKYGLSPKIINYGQLPSALFNTACGNGVMLFNSWDNEVSNPAFGFFPLKETLPIKIIHFSDNPNKIIPQLVGEVCALLCNNS